MENGNAGDKRVDWGDMGKRARGCQKVGRCGEVGRGGSGKMSRGAGHESVGG